MSRNITQKRDTFVGTLLGVPRNDAFEQSGTDAVMTDSIRCFCGASTLRFPAVTADRFPPFRDVLRRLLKQPRDQFWELLPDVWFDEHSEARFQRAA